jgi:uncharacterized membrane protein
MPRRRSSSAFAWALAVALLFAAGAPTVAQAQATFNYGEALQKSIFFYEAQIAGPKPPWSRVTWRGDSAMSDGSDVSRNLVGGWFDAGDHVKFGFPMAGSATMLAWSGVQYRSAFEATGQLPHLLNNLRVANDYFIRAHPSANELWGQVGTGGSDHGFWGSAEVMHLRTSRPSFRIHSGCGGSDLAAETAAAMAASSMVFRPTDVAYANTLLTHARQLFSFAESTHPSFYVDCIPDAAGFYNSHNGDPNDEMAWAAVWLFRATGEAAFLTRARQLYATMCKESSDGLPCYQWSQSWNDKHFGTYILMAQLTGEAPFHADARRWLNYWSQGAGLSSRTTGGGLMFVHSFGPIRYATNAAFLALIYADVIGSGDTDFTRYRNFGRRQVDYALGLNPRASSYVVGFGNNPPRNPHHRTAHGTWTNNPNGEPNPSIHTLFGGLVGGPTFDDNWADERNNFERTEVATDFNAGLTGALARLAQLFGGAPLANFPPIETPGDEIFIDARIQDNTSNATTIQAFIRNRSAWPSRIVNQASFRYYFTLEPGITPGQLQVQTFTNECGSGGGITGPTQFSGNIYFVNINCLNTNIYPGGDTEHRREVQFRITAPNTAGSWDPTNDYSFQGLLSTLTHTRNIVLFNAGTRIWGNEPPVGTGFTLSASPSTLQVNQGAAASSTLTITRSGGFTGGVTLSAAGLPPGVTAAFSVNPATGTTSQVTFTAAANAATGLFPVIINGTGTGVPAQSTSINLTVNPVVGGGFTLSATPASVTVVRGAAATSTINIARTGGFTGGVTLSTSGLPTGVTAAFSVNPATGASSVVTFTASGTATLGPANVTITGTSAGVPNQTAAITLTVNPAAGFTLSATPASVTVVRGATATSTVNIARTGGFAGGVTLSASGLPTGVTAAFSVNPATGASSVVTFTASGTATLGLATVTVTGAATGIPNQTTAIALTVNPAAGFTLSATPPSVSVVRSGSGTSTINIARTGGFAGAVTLAAGGLPTGVTAAFSPNGTTGASSTLTFTASATATLGPATVTVTGTATGIPNQTATITLTVNSAAGFTLSATPANVTVLRGATAASTINIARTGGFAAGVTLAATGLPTGVTAAFSASPATGASSTLTFSASAAATLGTASVTVTGTATGATPQTTSISLTVNPVGGVVTVTPLVNQNQPYFNEEAVRLDNTATLTAASVTIVIQRTTGVSFSGMYNTVGGQFAQTNSSTAAAITYQWTLGAGQTLPASTNRLFAAQAGGTGTPHPVSGDTWTVTYTTGGQTFTQSGTFGGGGGDFTLAASPTSLSVLRGASANSTVNISRSGGFSAPVGFTASGLPAGVTASFNPASATGNSTVVTFSASATAAAFPPTLVTITGTGGGITRTASVTLTLVLPGFGIAPSPASLTVVQGASASTTLNVTRQSGFTAALTCSVSGLPPGVTATFNPASVTGASSILSFATTGTATTGTFPLTISCTGGGVTSTATMSLVVAPAASFSLTSNPASLSVARGATAPATLTITRTGGFAGSVTLSAGGLPTGVTASFSANPTTGTSSTLTFSANATATLGVFAVTVTGTSGTLTSGTPINLTVVAGADFTLAPNPASLSIAAGGGGSSVLTVTRTGGFTAGVNCTVTGLPLGASATFAPPNPVAASATLNLSIPATVAPGNFTLTITCTSGGLTRTTTVALTVTTVSQTNAYTQRFLDLWDELHGTQQNNGYFHPNNVPYHSIETLMVEAPDHGHETTSEAYSFWTWLEVMYGRVTGNWTPLQQMFDSMEAFIIPTPADQPTTSFYDPADPADYAPEFDLPTGYPAPIDSALDTGSDPIGAQLQATYGTKDVYGMHWILDVDNFYGYGRRGDGTSQPSYINTFQRGPQESTWETVPHPSWEDFLSGGSLTGGFLPLFISGPTPAQQWRYTNAPDADARLIQAMYWANQFAPTNPTVASLSRKAARMGDYLRYAFFDKYFKTMGCASPQCPAGTGYNSAHYLLSWYYAWGGPIPPLSGWSFRIGSSHNHFGYQNPMAAHALTTVAALRPGNAADPNNQSVVDWRTSLDRQREFYRWLQSSSGGIAGGATNSWGGRYLAPPAGTATFYGMFYQENPVYLDPGSNTWFGFQVWSMERVAEYYHETNDPEAKVILDKWIPWAMANTRLPANGTFEVPSTLDWNGQPSLNWNATTQNWNPADTAYNAGLTVTVTEWGTDLGVTAALAKTFIYYSAGTRRWATHHTASQTMAKELLDRMWTLYRDEVGVSAPEIRRDYNRFDDPIFVPSSFSGTMANGDPVNSSSTFISIRSAYRNDPDWGQVQSYLDGGPAPTFRYHRFWAQADVALANAEYGRLFP